MALNSGELNLFDDKPQLIESAKDSARLGAAKAILQQQVELALSAGKHRAIRIGLFGALGQGKSSVLRSVELAIATRYRVQRFECSHYRRQQLEFEFDRMLAGISWGNKLANLAFGFMAALFIGISFFIPANWTPFGWDLKPLLQAFLALVGILLLPSWLYRQRAFERTFNLHGWGWPGWGVICKRLSIFFRGPQVLLIDDLDRANLKQQRAVLRALAKVPHSPPVIVVALDETQLLNAQPDPESPAELLRKFINVECRLPQRLQEDHVYLSLLSLYEFHDNNKEAAVSSSLLEAQLVGDICRVVGSLPNPGPRRIRNLINNLALCASQLERYHPSDISALLRILGLYELAPALRSVDERLVAALEECSNWEDFHNRCRAAILKNYPNAGGDANSDALKGIRGFYKLSRCMRPETISWAQLVGHQQDLSAPGAACYPVTVKEQLKPKERSDIGERLSQLRRVLVDAANGFVGDKLIPDECDPYCLWPMADVVLAHTRTVSHRQRLYIYLRKFIADSIHPETQKQDWFFCLYRQWFSDIEALDLCAPELLVEICQEIYWRYKAEALRLFLYLPGSQLNFQQRLALLANSASAGNSSNYRETSLVRAWLADYNTEDEASASPFISTYTNPNLLLNSWPLPKADSKNFGWHCRQFAMLLDENSSVALPKNLRSLWFDSGWLKQLAVDDLSAVLDGLADWLNPAALAIESWRLPDCLLELRLSKAYAGFLGVLTNQAEKRLTLTRRRLNTLLLLNCSNEETGLIARTLSIIGYSSGKMSPSLLRLLLASTNLQLIFFNVLATAVNLWYPIVISPVFAQSTDNSVRDDCIAILKQDASKLPRQIRNTFFLEISQ